MFYMGFSFTILESYRLAHAGAWVMGNHQESKADLKLGRSRVSELAALVNDAKGRIDQVEVHLQAVRAPDPLLSRSTEDPGSSNDTLRHNERLPPPHAKDEETGPEEERWGSRGGADEEQVQ